MSRVPFQARAVLDISTPPNRESAGRVVQAGVFDEYWQVKRPKHETKPMITKATLEKLAQYDTPTACNLVELFAVRDQSQGISVFFEQPFTDALRNQPLS